MRPGGRNREPKLRNVARTHDQRLDYLDEDMRRVIANERTTRRRVDTLEAFFAMSWQERVWWVLTGRCKYFTVTVLKDDTSTDQSPEPDAAQVPA